jgi:3-hydroxyisobutyrate dehydrogenase-like beta-hydroxyacid dehydrogenase
LSVANANNAPVAVIGLGRIGTGIAQSLLRDGCRVRVYNRTAEKVARLVAAGATAALSPAHAADQAAVVITSLLDDGVLRTVVSSEDGLLEAMAPGTVHVSTSTVSPGCSAELAALHSSRGQHFLAAPVLGRPSVALAGELVSLVGGETAALDRARAYIAAYSARIVHVGAVPGTANSLKLAFNFYLAATAELFGQFLAFTEKSGVDHEIAMQMLRELQGHPGVAGYLERIGGRAYDEVGFEMTTGLKDLQLMLVAAAAVRSPLPYASIVFDRTLSALATGLGDKDWSAFAEIARLNAGLGHTQIVDTSRGRG